MNCPICSSGECESWRSLYDDRYGFRGNYNLYRCGACKHVFIDCDLSSSAIEKLYTDYYPRSSFDVSDYRPHQASHGFHEWFDGLKGSAFRWVPENVRVLDIGCGFGETLGYHQARGCEVQGVEADENIRRVAERHGFDVHVGLFDPDNYENESFDYITMDQVLEHVSDPAIVMQGLAKVLRPDGHIVLSFPNAHGWGAKFFGRRWINWHVPYHMQFYSKRSLEILASEAGLTVESIRTITSSHWLHFQWLHLLLFPRPGVPSQFWNKPGERSVLANILCKAFGVVHRLKFNHLITRVFDALGVGDNYIVVLKKSNG